MVDLSTLENRLRDALELGAGAAETSRDLAAGARTRAAARRRQRFVGLGVGVGVAAVVAVGVGLATVVDDDPPSAEIPPAGVVERLTSGGRDAPSGWHFVQWRGVRIQVPNTWDSGALSEWCQRGPLLGVPVVERPGGPPAAECSDPALGYGVQFLGPRRSQQVDAHDVRRPRSTEASLYPRDSWVGITCAGCDVAVRVVAPSPNTARYLLDSYTFSP